MQSLEIEVLAFDAVQSLEAGWLRRETRTVGRLLIALAWRWHVPARRLR